MIDLDRLVSLAAGDLSDAEAELVDEHVLACGQCAATLESLLRIGGALRDVVRAGRTDVVATSAFVARLDAEGLVTRRYRLAAGETVACTVGSTDVFSVTQLEAGLEHVRRLALVRTSHAGSERTDDIPFDPRAGVVTIVSRADWIRTLPTAKLTVQLVAVDDAEDRVLGSYVLDHTAFAPRSV